MRTDRSDHKTERADNFAQEALHQQPDFRRVRNRPHIAR